MNKLKFSKANAKTQLLGKLVYSLDLPAGYSCPFANECRSQAVTLNGKSRIQDGPNCKFRCFSASQEALYTNVRLARWHNFNLLKNKSKREIVRLINKSLPITQMIRYHISGDFFNQSYFDAAIEVAKQHPKIKFYAYTKSLPFWIKRIGVIPKNFVLTASYGGTYDCLIKQYKLRSAKVVLNENTTLKLDKDDKIASGKRIKNFGLLLHGPQPAHTNAAVAWQKLKQLNKAGYKRANKFK